MPPRRVPLLFVQNGQLVVPDGEGGWKPAAERGQESAHARKLQEAHERVYLYDLDAQFAGTAPLDFYQRLERDRVHPWLDVGARKPEDVMDAFFAGAEALTIQLRHMPPELMEEVGEMAEADFYVGLTVDRAGVEKGLRPRDVVQLAQRVAATGVVLYEDEGADLHAAENVAFDLQRAGLPTAWVERPNSPHHRRAATSERFALHVVPEIGP
jgi:hypothetical protein